MLSILLWSEYIAIYKKEDNSELRQSSRQPGGHDGSRGGKTPPLGKHL